MPVKLRKELAADPSYKICLRNAALQDHTCMPNPLNKKLIEWEHALIYAGKQIQQKWAIVPLCWWAHSGPGLVKEINIWVALSRSTDEELQAISKVINYKRMKIALNNKYGVPNIKYA